MPGKNNLIYVPWYKSCSEKLTAQLYSVTQSSITEKNVSLLCNFNYLSTHLGCGRTQWVLSNGNFCTITWHLDHQFFPAIISHWEHASGWSVYVIVIDGSTGLISGTRKIVPFLILKCFNQMPVGLYSSALQYSAATPIVLMKSRPVSEGITPSH